MKKYILLFFVNAFISIYSYSQINESITFESNTPNLYIDSLTGVWQIGTPSKTIFNSAHSAPFALVTDTLNNYGNNLNDAAYFTLKLPAFYIGINLSFKYKIDTDSNNDYGVLEILNNNNNWVNILHTTLNVDNIMFTNTIAPTHYNNFFYQNNIWKFTGTNSNWMDFNLMICQIVALSPNNESTLRGGGDIEFHFRFRFISDNTNTNKEGWMIDDISVIENLDCASNVKENLLENLISIYPNPTTGVISLEFMNDEFKNSQNISCKVYDISGKETYNSPLLRRGAGGEVNLNHLQSGIYFLQLTNGDNFNVSKKIVIQR